MDWDDLRIFLALHRSPSIRAAAERLGVSHSTVSRRLQTLEKALGATLFFRHADGFSPTETGRDLVAHAERIESDMQRLQLEVLGRDSRLAGRLRVAAPPLLAQHLVMPILAEFSRLYPAIDLEVVATYAFTDLDRQHADLAIRFQHDPDPHLVGRRLPALNYSVYATPEYIASHRFQRPNADAAWIIWSAQDRTSGWFRGTPLPDCRLGPMIADPLVQIAAARAGMGMIYSPCFLGDADPGLRRVPGVGVMPDRPGWVLSHPDARSTERVRRCATFLAEGFARHAVALAGSGQALA